MSRRRKSIIAAIVAVAAGVAIACSCWPPFGDSSRDSASDPEVLPITPVNFVLPKAGLTTLPLRAGHFVSFACEVTFDGLTFFDPVFVAPLPDGSGRLAVVERRGTVQLVSQRDGKFSKQPLLDITARVQIRATWRRKVYLASRFIRSSPPLNRRIEASFSSRMSLAAAGLSSARIGSLGSA